jgi:replicative DNA helicase
VPQNEANGSNDNIPNEQPARGRSRTTSLLEVAEALEHDIYYGSPPVEYQVASPPWGSLAFRPGEIIALAAPPAMGKTAFIMQTLVDALRLNQELKCLIANVEMNPQRLYERQLARLSGIPLGDITRRQNLLGQRHVMDLAINTICSVGDRMHFMSEPFHINSIEDAMVQDVQPDVLVIDYLQRIGCCEGVADARSRLNSLMLKFRTFANAGVCVVLVSAVGRPGSKKGGGYNPRELGLASLRESSEIEYGCDDVFVMVPEEHDGTRDGDGYRNVLLKHEKSRNNLQQDLRFEFNGAIQSFTLLPPLSDHDDDGFDDPGDSRPNRNGPNPGQAAVWTPPVEEPRRLMAPGDTFAARLIDGDA